MPEPTMLLSSRARIEYWNDAAATLLARADPLLADHGGGLTAIDREQTERLWAAIARTALTQRSADLAEVMSLTCRRDTGQVMLFLTPFRRPTGPADAQASLVLATITEPAARPDPATILQERYHLTPAEARLALAVTRIQPLEAAAVALGIGRETAKSHLRVVFGKMGVHRQAQLVAVVGEISRVGHPNGG